MAGRVWRAAVLKLPRLSLTRIVIILAVLAVGYFVFAAVDDTILSQRLDQDEHQIQREIAEFRRDQAKLEAIREYLQTDEYIEGVARRLLGLVRPGETLVIVSSNIAPTPAALEQNDEEERHHWWEELYGP